MILIIYDDDDDDNDEMLNMMMMMKIVIIMIMSVVRVLLDSCYHNHLSGRIRLQSPRCASCTCLCLISA